jgi:hypothetical protein
LNAKMSHVKANERSSFICGMDRLGAQQHCQPVSRFR